MESGFFTKRGRRMLVVLGVVACWVGMVAMFGVATATHSAGWGWAGISCAAAAVASTVCMALARHTELVREAFQVGVEAGRAEVRELRR